MEHARHLWHYEKSKTINHGNRRINTNQGQIKILSIKL